MDADGLHVGQDDLPAKAARALIGPDKILGVVPRARAQCTSLLLLSARSDGCRLIAARTRAAVCQRRPQA